MKPDKSLELDWPRPGAMTSGEKTSKYYGDEVHFDAYFWDEFSLLFEPVVLLRDHCELVSIYDWRLKFAIEFHIISPSIKDTPVFFQMGIKVIADDRDPG